MLVRMWRKRTTPPLLVGLQARTTILEISEGGYSHGILSQEVESRQEVRLNYKIPRPVPSDMLLIGWCHLLKLSKCSLVVSLAGDSGLKSVSLCGTFHIQTTAL